MRRTKVLFAGQEIDFMDRDLAIRWIEDLAERGTHNVFVIYGPEGCGKTAFFKQATEVLKEHGYSVVHVNPMAERIDDKLLVTDELRGLIKDVMGMIPNPFKDAVSLIDFAVELLYTAVKRSIKNRIAILADDVFQAVGLDKAEQLVKGLLNMIEWPSIKYEKIVVLVGSSEGISAERIGRHRWADFFILWNMNKEGFRQLYDVIPGNKPPFDDAWKWTGGNPKYLENLYLSSWDVDYVVKGIIQSHKLSRRISMLSDKETEVLREAINDPDALIRRIREAPNLINKLMELNLIVELFDRDPRFWIDTPPPEGDPELGIGKYIAWQTPLHREAIRKTLEGLGS